jgi:phenylacetate-CoA ligase
MSLTDHFFRYVGLPLVDWARRSDSLRAYREMCQTQWWSAEELAALQLQRLRALLIHAGLHVPYYREVFRGQGFVPEKVNSLAGLVVLPFITKEVLRREGSRLLADNAERFQPRAHRSAGTTGQPIIIQMDRRRHSVAWADMYRWWNAGGWELGDRQFVVAGAALRPRQISGFKSRIYGWLNHFESSSSFQLEERELDSLLMRMERCKDPVFLRGYASSMHVLARHAIHRHWNGQVKAVFTTAETLFPEQRAQIESGLHCRVFDQWGCRDGGISAFECEHHAGLHLAVENAVVEICRDNQPVASGEMGEVVATDLFSFAMPIIRYKVGDVATMSSTTCSCGRGLPLVASVQGRVSGFLIGSGGRRVHGEFFSHIFWETPWVREFQVIQEKLGEIIVNIVPQETPPKFDDLLRLMQEQTGPDCRVRIEIVNDIPPGPLGKRQFIICKVPVA